MTRVSHNLLSTCVKYYDTHYLAQPSVYHMEYVRSENGSYARPETPLLPASNCTETTLLWRSMMTPLTWVSGWPTEEAATSLKFLSVSVTLLMTLLGSTPVKSATDLEMTWIDRWQLMFYTWDFKNLLFFLFWRFAHGVHWKWWICGGWGHDVFMHYSDIGVDTVQWYREACCSRFQ